MDSQRKLWAKENWLKISQRIGPQRSLRKTTGLQGANRTSSLFTDKILNFFILMCFILNMVVHVYIYIMHKQTNIGEHVQTFNERGAQKKIVGDD